MKELIAIQPFLKELGIDVDNLSFEEAVALKIAAKNAVWNEMLSIKGHSL